MRHLGLREVEQDAKGYWERPMGERPMHDGYAISGDMRLAYAERFWV
jgi:hypothetical protein